MSIYIYIYIYIHINISSRSQCTAAATALLLFMWFLLVLGVAQKLGRDQQSTVGAAVLRYNAWYCLLIRLLAGFPMLSGSLALLRSLARSFLPSFVHL